MKANELMIGDWARIKKDIIPEDAYWMHDDMHPGQAIRVEEILSYAINPDWYGGEINDCIPEDAIEPIPLTAEILEKNGFEPTLAPSERVWRHNSQEVWLDNEGKNYWANIKNGEFYFEGYVEYIHELQHCLKLVGINKEIIL